ncbi:disulfide bond formation protein B [Epibacterium ulvae]|uniref:disulfide bond formation protein B n=1 Tax=Epibacterium ulvae TaxID=1156985 RepID=UPI0024921FB2|nr:disulfide bond formation protein B [Epibacterium ulvae]
MSRFLIFIAALGSAALLLGAFGFQHLGGFAPCKMCIWQRYPHAIAIGIGVLATVIPGAILPYLGALAALSTAGIGAFHFGVEQEWWEGPSTCTSGPIGNLTPEQLMEQIMTAPLVRCDEIAWSFMNISMAGWNAIASFALAILWISAARHTQKAI